MGKNVIQIILKGVDKSSAAFKSADKSASGFKKALKGVAVGAGVAAAAVGAFALSSVKLAARVETLAVVTKILGENAGYTEKQIRGVEESIAAQGITVRAARQSVAKMIQSNLDLAKATDLATMAQNAAVIAGTDSSEAFNRLVNTIQTANVRMGRTMGLALNFGKAYEEAAGKVGRTAESLTAAEKAIVRTNHVLEQGKNITGAYEAAMETAGKQITSFPRYIEEIKVALGDILLPTWTEVIFATKEWTTSLRDLIIEHRDYLVSSKKLAQAGLDEEAILLQMTGANQGLLAQEVLLEEEKKRLIRVMETETNRWQLLADSILGIPELVSTEIEVGGLEEAKADFIDFADTARAAAQAVHEAWVEDRREFEAEMQTGGLGGIQTDILTKGVEQGMERAAIEAAGVAVAAGDVSSWAAARELAKEFGMPLIDAKNEVLNIAAELNALDGKTIEVFVKTIGAGLLGDDAGGQHGLNMIVPPGYPNDSYKVGVSSGEELIVKTPAQQKAGDNNSRSFVVNNYISTDIEQQSYEDMFKRMATRN